MRLKAFSFLEVLFSIVISGIIISTAYSIYVYTYQRFYRFTEIKTEIRDYFEFNATLNRELETSKKIIQLNQDELEVQLVDKTIIYAFQADYVLRTLESSTDTFFFPVSTIDISVINELSEELLVDYIELEAVDDGGTKSFSFYKDYGAITKIED